MDILIQGRNLQITDRLREYVQKKTDTLDRHLSTATDARMELTTEQTRSAEDSQVAQLTVHSKGILLRAEERSADIFTSVDMVIDKMQRQIDRYKSKRRSRYRSSSIEPSTDWIEEEAEEVPEIEIVRTKRFSVTPMNAEEAVEQMELLGHNFFVFYNPDDGEINVVYARRDGTYGLIQPELV